MISVLYGTDRLAIDERVASARANVDPTGFSTTVIDDALSNLDEVRNACGAIGFFGTGRIIVARDLLQSATRRSRRTKNDSKTEDAINLLSDVPQETMLLVVEPALDPKTEREIRRAAPTATVERYDVPRGQRLVEWVSDRARRYDAVIGQQEARQLLEALFPGNWPAESRRDDVPPDLYRLDNEIAKLATAAGNAGTIDAEHVQSLVPGADAQDFWGITNAIMSGDAAKAVMEIERAYSFGSAAEAILGQVTSQFEVLAVAALAERDTSLSELSSVSGLSEGRLRASARYATAFPSERIALALDALRQIDAEAKQGMVELSVSLVPLIAELASNRAS